MTVSTRVGVVVQKSATDHTQIDTFQITRARVQRQGARQIDTAMIQLPAGTDVALNDRVSYLQDEAELQHLTAIYNFQGSYRDESGFHHDGTRASNPATDSYNTDGFYSPSVLPNDNKFKGNYGLYFTDVGQEVEILDKVTGHSTAALRIPEGRDMDFSRQFDIQVFFNNLISPANSWSDTNSTQILFSKYDTTNNRGVEIGLKRIGSGTGRKWVVYAKVDTTTLTGDGSLQSHDTSDKENQIEYSTTTNKARMIRLFRDEENVVTLLLDDNIDGTDCQKTIATNANRVTAPAYLGTNNENAEGTTSTNYDFKGIIWQLRVYCGGYLSQGDANRVLTAAAQQMTQKISGVVWNRQDKLKSVIIEIRSVAKVILDANLNDEVIDGTVASGTANEPATHVKNLFDAGQAAKDIMATILYNAGKNEDGEQFIFRVGKSNSTTIVGKYAAVGGFVQNTELLMAYANQGFMTFPTKVFMYEYGTGTDGDTNLDSGLTFDDKYFRIFQRGEDDIKIVNKVEVIGDIQLGYHEQKFGRAVSGQPHDPYGNNFTYNPINPQIVFGTTNNTTPSATHGSFVPTDKVFVDFDKKQLSISDTYGSGSDTDNFIWAKYNYEIIKGISSNAYDDDSQLRHSIAADTTDSDASIAKYGLRSRKVYMPQLQHKTDFESIAQKLRNDFMEEKPRYTIVAPFLLNCLRENLRVTLTSDLMKFPNASGSSTSGKQIVKSIEWKYPECTTKIEVGDYKYSAFDFEKMSSDSTSALTTGVNRTRT